MVDECVKSLEEKGVVNYFGPQRFGYLSSTRGCVAPHIGLAMLQGNHVREMVVCVVTFNTVCVCVCVCVCALHR